MLGSDRVTLTGNLPKDHKSLNVIITCSFTLDIYTWYEFIFTKRKYVCHIKGAVEVTFKSCPYSTWRLIQNTSL